jgi:eukaryotic-like serine/threonine-protein kinase
MMATAQSFRGTSRFEVLSELGHGASGAVYEVLDRERNARLALKALRTLDAESILLLKDEFRTIQDLVHPNLVTPKELFEENGQWFFTMDLVEGSSFLAHVRPWAPPAPDASRARLVADGRSGAAGDAELDMERLRASLKQLAIGLCALHADHKVHRDIKPSNVLVTSKGLVRILDFGIVSDLGREDTRDDRLVGTALYMAPEQATGEAVTPAADWYAVGAMLYQALTRRLPFEGGMSDVMTAKVICEPAPPDAIVPDLSRDLVALCVDLLRLDPARRPEGFDVLKRLGVDAPEALIPARAVAFVGRRRELALLDEAYARVADGHAVTCLVEGESGVGKSQLVKEFTRRVASGGGALLFRGRCYERESVPYKAVDTLFDELARFLASLPDEEAARLLPDQAALLRHLFPVLDAVPAFEAAPAARFDVVDPKEVRARVFEVLRALFVRLAQHHRVVLVIDDLQWADSDSLALLSEVLRPPDAPALLLLASIRTGSMRMDTGEDVHSRVGQLPGDVRHLRVEALPASEARDLIRQLLLGADARSGSDGEVEAIFAEADGHPLFIDELVRHRAMQRMHREESAPTRLDEALWERAMLLQPAARKLLELVAVAGVPISQLVVAQAAALDFGQVFDSVGTLRAAHFVRTSGVYRRDTVEPYHDRVRESVLRHLDPAVRAGWHGRLAVALEQANDVDSEKLILHWQGAGNTARAAEYAIRAADQARSALAFDHAATLYRLALELGKPEGDAARALQVKLAEALTNAGRGAEAAQVYLAAAGTDDSNHAIDLRRRAAGELVCSGHLDEGNATIQSVLHAVGIDPPKTPLTIIVSLIYRSLLIAVRGLGFVSRREAEVDPRALLRIDCLWSASTGMTMIDHVRGKELQLRTLVEALRVGEPGRVARALGYYAAGHSGGGRPAYARTVEIGGMVRALGVGQKEPFLEGFASLVFAYAEHMTGRWNTARVHFERAEVIFRDQCVGVTFELASVRMLLFRAYAWLGALKTLTLLAEPVLRDAEKRRDLYTVVNVRANTMAFLSLMRDDVADAERELALAARDLPKNGFHVQHALWLITQLGVLLYRGEPARVLGLLAERWPTIRRSMLLRVQMIRIPFEDARVRACLLLIASGAPDAPAFRKVAERGIRALEREHLDWADALASVLRAGLVCTSGTPDHRRAATLHLIAAEKGFEALGANLMLAVARRRRGELVGGAEGRSLVASAEGWMSAEGVREPNKVCALYAPAVSASLGR